MEDPRIINCRTCSETLDIPRNLCDTKYKSLLDLINRILGYEVQSKGTAFNICDSCGSKMKWILEFKELWVKSLAKFQDDSHCKQEVVDMDNFNLCLEDGNFDYKLDDFQSEVESPTILLKNNESDTENDLPIKKLKILTRKRKRNNITTKRFFAKNNLIDDSDSDTDVSIRKFKRTRRKIKRSNCSEKREEQMENDALEDGRFKDKVLAQFTKDVVEKAFKEFLKPFELNRQCVVCNTLVSSRKRLAWHMSATHKDAQDKWCNICNTLSDNLEEHKINHNDLFKCPFCERLCKPEIIPFKGHIERHTDSAIDWDYFPCKYCPVAFPYINELKDHKCPKAPPGAEQEIEQLMKPKRLVQNKWEETGKRYKQYSFEQVERALKETMKDFHTIRQCCICGDIKNNKKYLTIHMNAKHKKLKNRWCDGCNKIVNKLAHHKKSHKIEDKSSCRFCRMIFKNKSNLQDHLMKHSKSSHFKPKLDWFLCPNCAKAFPYEDELQNHKCRDFNVDLKENLTDDDVPIIRNDLKNTISIEKPNTKASLINDKEEWLIKKVKNRKWSKLEQFPHEIVDKAMKEAMRPFYTFRLCPICNFLSKNRQSLGTHIGKHKGAKSRWCTRCNTLVDNLTEHMETHEEFLFNCPFCDKKFNRGDDFNGHMLRHSLSGRKFNEKWYCCAICPAAFPHEDELKIHTCVPVPVIKVIEDTINDPSNDLEGVRSDLKAVAKVMKRAKSKLELFPHQVVEQAMKEAMRPFYTIRECPICEKLTINRRILGNHINSYHKENKCKWCSRCNNLFNDLEEHVKQVHEESLFTCPLCRKEFPDGHDIEEHMHRHSLYCGRKIERKWFICQFCPSSFRYQVELGEHKCPNNQIEKENARHELQLCLKTKMQPPQTATLKACPICKTEVKYLTYHLKKVHNKFRKKVNLRMASVKRGSTGKSQKLCSFCGKTFHHINSLNAHIMSRHTGERPFKCSYCEKAFVSNTSKKNHEDSMHGGERKYFCDVCGKACASSSTLCIHKKIHEDQPPQQCPICEKYYVRPSMLKIHMKRHTEANRFSCAQCNSSYHLKRLLLKHLRTHTNERPFKCRFCDKTWRFKAECTIHERVHTGTYPYTCSVCSYSTTKAYSLTLHMKQHPEDAPQANNPYKCPMCFRSYSTRALQMSHTKNVHMSFTEKGLRLDYVDSKEK